MAAVQPRGDESQYKPEDDIMEVESATDREIINQIYPAKQREDMAMNRVKLIKQDISELSSVFSKSTHQV